jgi:hypothetical protein
MSIIKAVEKYRFCGFMSDVYTRLNQLEKEANDFSANRKTQAIEIAHLKLLLGTNIKIQTRTQEVLH